MYHYLLCDIWKWFIVFIQNIEALPLPSPARTDQWIRHSQSYVIMWFGLLCFKKTLEAKKQRDELYKTGFCSSSLRLLKTHTL